MILHQIKLHNFGIYAGDTVFPLTPQHQGQFNRPIILFRGQNGVGKTTLVEAMRLCLHGRLSLGNRTTQRDYESYLTRQLHRNEAGETAVSAHIQLDFEHTQLGKQHQYRVIRSWEVQNGRFATDLNIWVDDQPIMSPEDEKEFLLRELIPPGVVELFFFDGEKIATLSESGDASSALLADSVKNLLGLHLVEQLDRDLDIYLTRQTGIQEMQQVQDELKMLNEEQEALFQQRQETVDMLTNCRTRLHQKREEITLLEQRIAQEGGSYAEKQSARETKRRKLTQQIAQVEQEIYELGRGLLPFAAAPKLLRSLQKRLNDEAAYERWQASQPILEEVSQRIQTKSATEAYWEDVTDEVPGEAGQAAHQAKIAQLLASFAEPPMAKTAVIHNVSAETRGVLQNWIDDALTNTPKHFIEVHSRYQQLKAALADLDEALKRVPREQILQPLRDNLRQLDREHGRLEAEQERLAQEENRLTYHLDRIAGSKRRVSEHIATIDTDEGRLKLAARTKLMLAEYQTRLIQQKLDKLAAQLSKRFNQLSRKRNFIERVTIDPDSFGMTLYRNGQPFPRTQLSAGEEQIFAIATLWALREVSERPLPVIIDTPLSRLDDEHRRTMLTEFMPQVAQQVIVLATNTEIDDDAFTFMQPAISRAYLLQATSHHSNSQSLPLVNQPNLIGLEEIKVDVD